MSFAQTRSRRPNAGNRMRALLNQEIEMEDLFEITKSDEEEEEEQEFQINEEDEVPDAVDSDFDTESSEEEREQEKIGQELDKEIEREERQARRATTTIPVRKFSQPPQQPATTDREAIMRPKRARKPSAKAMESAETVLRQSSRSNTVKSRLLVEEQMREYQERKSQAPKKDKPVVKELTQEELLAEAEITERENRESLELWQQREAERKAREKRKKEKKGMAGPYVRYRSFTDGTPDERPKQRKIVMIESTEAGDNVQYEITDPAAVAWQRKCDMEQSDMVGRNLISFITDDNAKQINISGLNDKELDRTDLIPSLENWADRRPRPIKPLICPITGLPAKYRDPKTSVPYASKEAFRTIRACLNNQVVWSATHGIYLGEPMGAKGVPDGWEQMMKGKSCGMADWQLDDGSFHYPEWYPKSESSSRRKRQSSSTANNTTTTTTST